MTARVARPLLAAAVVTFAIVYVATPLVMVLVLIAVGIVSAAVLIDSRKERSR